MRVREEPFDKTHEIAKAAGVPFRFAPNATLIAADDALAFLDACRTARVQILGAEGFDLMDGGLRPDEQAILDLSDVTDASASVDEAQTFAADVGREGLMFDFRADERLTAFRCRLEARGAARGAIADDSSQAKALAPRSLQLAAPVTRNQRWRRDRRRLLPRCRDRLRMAPQCSLVGVRRRFVFVAATAAMFRRPRSDLRLTLRV